MYMKGIGQRIKPMGKEFIHMLMELNMKANGRTTNNRDKAKKFGLMVPSMLEPIKRVLGFNLIKRKKIRRWNLQLDR